MYGNSGHG
jgi:hypothetical protein